MESSHEAGTDQDRQSASPGTTPVPPERKVIFLLLGVAFLNMMGIGLVNPVLPFILQRYLRDAHMLALVAGILVSTYAVCQFLAAPALGALSDRYGRRPLLLICLLGSALGYALFGVGGALWVLFLSRVIDGLTGGNASILFAYIGDISSPQERGKYFGMFGATIGVGFIVGPIVGSLASKLSYEAPVYIAAALSAIAFLWGCFGLPESLRKEHRAEHMRLSELNPLQQLFNVFALPQLRWLLLAIFFFGLPFAVLQSNSVILVKDSLGWGSDSVGLIFSVVGVVDILMQGVLIGRLLPVFGEMTLTMGGLVCEMLAYGCLGAIVFLPSPFVLFAGIVLFAVGTGLLEPSLNGLISRAAGPRQQGRVQGGSQAMQSLAVILGPLWGGALYTQSGHATPYWSGVVFVALAVLAVFLARPALQAHNEGHNP